jgi:hypothetical protein
MASLSTSTGNEQVSADLMNHFMFQAVQMFTEAEREMDAANVSASPSTDDDQNKTSSPSSSPSTPISAATSKPSPNVVRKIENMGFCVGRRLMERRTRDGEAKRLENRMSVMRHICKDFWPVAFDHPATGLQTNNRGIFVIKDGNFKLIQAIGPVEGVDQKDIVRKYLVYPCGLLRGALASLGLACVVDAMVEDLPLVKFQVHCSPMVPSRG